MLQSRRARLYRFRIITVICLAALLEACTTPAAKVKTGVQTSVKPSGPAPGGKPGAAALPDAEIADVLRIPQQVDPLAVAAGDRLNIGDACRNQLLEEFYRNFFRPWTSPAPLNDVTETADFMRQEGRSRWSGVNKRRVPKSQLQVIMDNCALDTFPSRNQAAIAVAPAHLRGLPTQLPLYKPSEGAPFDMLSYPQVKLNEPLRVLHRSRDGAWLFVESPYSNGWLETRDVALVDRGLMDTWMHSPHVVMIRDLATVPDGRGIGTYQSKTGTVLPLVRQGDGWWEVRVASAGEGGMAVVRSTRIPEGAAAPFPLPFDQANVTLIGDELLGEPYGWGEIYGLRDCSALLRDFFLPFGIWLPRTASDQIASVRPRVELSMMPAAEKEDLIRKNGVPFLTLLFKPGHIMLYAGLDREGRPLVFQNAWSIKVQDGSGERTKILGGSMITTLKPGEELGLVPGSSLLDRVTVMGTVTGRCKELSRRNRTLRVTGE
jgi:hypothetical protein